MVGRHLQTKAAIPTIAARPSSMGAVFGTSTAVYGFLPDVFDSELKERGISIESYNLAVPLAVPSIQRVYVDRFVESMQREGRKAEVSIIAFPPYQVTTANLHSRPERTEAIVRNYAMVLDTQDWVRLARSQPDLVVRLGFAGTLNPFPRVPSMLYTELLPRPAWWPTPSRPPSRTEADRELVLDHGTGSWSLETRGRPNFDRLGQEAWNRLQPTEEQYPKDEAQFIADEDPIELHMVGAELREFIECVNELKAVSRRVVITLPPMRPSLRPSPSGLVRLESALDRIGRETHVPIVNMYLSEEFSTADFRDTHHMVGDGPRKWTTGLAKSVAEMWSTAVVN
jgi:hypothetical protein